MAKSSGSTRKVTASTAAQNHTLSSKAFSSFSAEIKNEISNYKGLSDEYKEMISKDLKPFDTQFKKLQAQMDKLQSQHDNGDISDSKFSQAYNEIEKKMDNVKFKLRVKMANTKNISSKSLKTTWTGGYLPNG